MRSTTTLSGALRQFQQPAADAADHDLLARYAEAGDDAAFAAVVHRYAGLVLGVARRQLADRDRAEDVFQATFLSLARAAGRLDGRRSLANWLYTVALRQASKARAVAARRAVRERAVAPRAEASADPLDEITGRELLRVIDEEIARLPERLRLPVLLCCVRGLSREEAAAQLGWSPGTVKGRLERGRQRLAARLAARGLAPSAVLLAPLVAVAVPDELIARTVELVAAPWSNAIPPAVVQLARAAEPRRALLGASVVGSVLAVGLAGWAVASGDGPLAEPPTAPAAPVVVAPPADPPADPLPATAMLRFGTSRYRHGVGIASLAVSRDGKLAVVSSGGHVHGKTRAFDLTDGRVLYALEKDYSRVEAVAISPDGKTVAVKVSNDIQLYDAATGNELGKVELARTGGGTLTDWLAFTPDGKAVALTQGDSRGVVLVDLEKGAVRRTFKHSHVVYAAAFSPDGKRMVAGGYDSDKDVYFARLWEVATGKELRRLPHGRAIRTVAYSPDGKLIATGGDGGSCRLWEADTGKLLQSFPADGYRVRSVAFSPDGRTLAAAGDAIRLYDTATGKERRKMDRKAVGLHFAADGTALTAGVGGTIHRWDPATGEQLTPPGADSGIDQIVVTPDGKRLITRDQGGGGQVWDAATGKLVRRIAVAWQREIALSPDGRFLVWPVEDESVKYKKPAEPNTIYTGNRLRMYDLAEDKFVERFGSFEGDAWAADFTPDGKELLTTDYAAATVRVWDVATGKERRSFRLAGDEARRTSLYVWRAVLSPDGKTLAVTYQRPDNTTAFFGDYAVRLWDVATGKQLHEMKWHLYYVEAVAFSPDGKLLVTGSKPLEEFAQKQLNRLENQVYVWDVATGQQVKELPVGLPIGASAAAFSPDGKALATASPDGTIRIWDVGTWKVQAEFRGHRDRVQALAFGPDGRLFSGSLDATVLAWDLTRPKQPK